MDVSYVPSEDEKPPKQSVRMTRSKDVKFKSVSGATTNSKVGMKGGRSEKVYKTKKATRGGGSKGRGFKEGSGQPVSAGGTEEGGGQPRRDRGRWRWPREEYKGWERGCGRGN